MGEAVLNYPVQRIIPQNGTYTLCDGGGKKLITLSYKAVNDMIQKHEDVLEDLANKNLVRTQYYGDDGMIIYSMRQPNENANPASILCIEKDNQVQVVLELEACDLMIRMAKIIRHHEQNDQIHGYSLKLNTQKRLDIDILGNRLTIVDERHGNAEVTFPLIVLAYLWTRYGDIHREITEEHFNDSTFWSHGNLTIRRMRLTNDREGGSWNVLHFQSMFYVQIILRTFKEMLKETAGDYFSDEAPSDESDEDEAAMPLSRDKTFQFPVPGRPNHFRIKNEYNKYYNLPTAALDAAIQNKAEIDSYLQGDGDEPYRESWSDEDYALHVSSHKNSPRDIDVRTIKFIRRSGCLLLVAYTAETFGRILEEYQGNMKTIKYTMPTSL